MKLTTRLRADGSTSSSLGVLLFFVALTGCGGSTYSLGTVKGDGGPNDDEGGTVENCFSPGPGETCDGGSTTSGGFGFDTDGGNSGVTCSSGDCDAASGFSVDEGGSTVGSACTASASIACAGGATGYACQPATNPELEQPGLACTSPIINGSVDFCCFPWPGGNSCTPLPDFQCDSNSYAFQCAPGDSPDLADAKLACGQPFPDSNGSADYCCTY